MTNDERPKRLRYLVCEEFLLLIYAKKSYILAIDIEHYKMKEKT